MSKKICRKNTFRCFFVNALLFKCTKHHFKQSVENVSSPFLGRYLFYAILKRLRVAIHIHTSVTVRYLHRQIYHVQRTVSIYCKYTNVQLQITTNFFVFLFSVNVSVHVHWIECTHISNPFIEIHSCVTNIDFIYYFSIALHCFFSIFGFFSSYFFF